MQERRVILRPCLGISKQAIKIITADALHRPNYMKLVRDMKGQGIDKESRKILLKVGRKINTSELFILGVMIPSEDSGLPNVELLVLDILNFYGEDTTGKYRLPDKTVHREHQAIYLKYKVKHVN